MKRILITGGAGFIGSNLCEKLVKENNDVICLDNYYSGSKENVWKLIGKENFELVRHDVCMPYYAEIDEIYNLACPASPIYYQKDPIQTTKTSFLGAINMLGLAKRTGAKILQASTSEIYGNPLMNPQKEEYWGNVNPHGIRSCYDEGKRVVESLFFDYQRKHDIDCKIIRIFNTYGPNMQLNDGRVVTNFIVQALTNNPITIYGDGEQTRSFQYIDDLIDGMVKMMSSPKGFIGPINLGNPQEFTMNELAKIIIGLTNSKSKIIYQELSQDDPMQRKPDITLAKRKLNWCPKVKLEEGLCKMIKHVDIKLNKNEDSYIDYFHG
jgi:UDP-glucuronate decarboxylase